MDLPCTKIKGKLKKRKIILRLFVISNTYSISTLINNFHWITGIPIVGYIITSIINFYKKGFNSNFTLDDTYEWRAVTYYKFNL